MANRYTVLSNGATAFTFNGSTDLVSIPHGAAIDNLPNITLEWGLYLNALPGTGLYAVLFAKNYYAAWWIGINENGRILIYRGSTGGIDEWYTTNVACAAGNWYELQITWAPGYPAVSGATPTIRVNDTNYALTHYSTGSGNWTDDSLANALCCGYDGTAYPFNGTDTIFRLFDVIQSTAYQTDNFNVDKGRWMDLTLSATPDVNVSESLNVDSTATAECSAAPAINISESLSVDSTSSASGTPAINVSESLSVDPTTDISSTPDINISESLGIDPTATADAEGTPTINVSESLGIDPMTLLEQETPFLLTYDGLSLPPYRGVHPIDFALPDHFTFIHFYNGSDVNDDVTFDLVGDGNEMAVTLLVGEERIFGPFDMTKYYPELEITHTHTADVEMAILTILPYGAGPSINLAAAVFPNQTIGLSGGVFAQNIQLEGGVFP